MTGHWSLMTRHSSPSPSERGMPLSSTITSRRIAVLPESLWPEASRRLRLAPELWALAADPQILEAFCALGGDARKWTAGPLAMAAYAVRHPECKGSAETWLPGEGRDRTNAA